MRFRNAVLSSIALSLVVLATGVRAQGVDTVNWAADGTADGTGTGTLGSITVSYNSVPGGNSGITIGENWNTSLATAGAVGTGVTHLTGGVLGTTTGTNLQTIAFSSSITNPLLFVNFTDSTSSMTFGNTLTFLSSNNAQLSGGNTVNFVGSTNTSNDGFAARVTGVFGPGTPLTFNYTTSVPFDSVGFTVAVPQASTPEPGGIAFLMTAGFAGVGCFVRRKRK